jgi:S1-C subfamily serine protease
MSQTLLSLSNDLAAAVSKASESIVAINARPRTPSSGVVWQAGVVVTTDHTTERDDDITLTLPGGQTVPATLAGRDPSTDLAVLRFTDPASTPAAATALAPKVGQLALAVGRGPSAALGLVSTVSGPWRTWRGGHIDDFVRLDVAVYHGFSGGALVDASGSVLGINTSALARGLPMTIPAATVNRVLGDLLQKGHVARGYLGVGMQPVRLAPAVQQKLGLPAPAGVIILSVEPDSPAEKAGVLVGDVLIALDGKPAADTDDVQAALDPSSVGKSLHARILRAGTMIELPLKVGERPRGV